MTTITVAKKGGQIAIASDRLTTFGDTRLSARYEPNAKIFKVKDTWIGIAGSSAHHHVIEHAFKKVDKPMFGNKTEIFDIMVRLHPLLKEHFFLNPKEEDDDPYESSQYVLLMANPSGIYGVYSYREVFAFERFWSIGSGRCTRRGTKGKPDAKWPRPAAMPAASSTKILPHRSRCTPSRQGRTP